jgi:hypothetical protein
LDAPEHRREEWLRAALEFAFDLSRTQNDDGILKYAIRQLDKSEHHWDEWKVLQPFLMRSAIHFGHTIDYVVRVLVWRKLSRDDIDEARWSSMVTAMLDYHGRLGNDSEVCWLLFAAEVLKITIADTVSLNIVQNCGALSVVAIMNFIGNGASSVFSAVLDRIGKDDADGPMWPVFLEWAGSGWSKHGDVKKLIKSETLLGMADNHVYLFDSSRLTRVFNGIEPSKFSEIPRAIEERVSFYDDDEENDDDDDNDDVES